MRFTTKDNKSIIIYLLLLIASPVMGSFYHSDHLGSANWITDKNGAPVQYLHYLPYGQLLANQQATGSTYDERYKFTGKERDEESGTFTTAGSSQGIDNVQSEQAQGIKILRNDQILILRGDKIYTLQGQLVK